MKITKKIISWVLSLAIVACVFPPVAFADFSSNDDERGYIGNFWDAYFAHSVEEMNMLDLGLVTNAANWVSSKLSRNVCEFSTDGYHHCDTPDYVSCDSQGYFIHCTCSDCHQEYEIRSSEMPAGYDSVVDDMPVNGITNTGSFVWYPTVKDLYLEGNSRIGRNYVRSIPFECDDYNTYLSFYLSDNGDGVGVDIYPCVRTDLYMISVNYQYTCDLKFPVSGVYKQLSSVCVDGSGLDVNGRTVNFNSTYKELDSSYRSAGSIAYYMGANTNAIVYSIDIGNRSNFVTLHFKEYFPTYSVTPDVSALVGHENDYTVDTRPAAYIKYFDERIIDESTNTFYMPETNETYDMREWSYDYSDRSYHVTTNEGDKYTVTYGDENMTVYNETSGDTYTYNYYITQEPEPSPTPTPDDPNHKHTYTTETVKEATCTEPGSVKYTCSGCGHSYTESVPSLGHDWVASETVEDSYSFPDGVTCPNGADHGLTYTLNKDDRTYHVTCSDCGKEFDVDAVFAYGHTTYTCSRCGEQRVESNKDSGGLFDAIGDLIANGIRWITDKLVKLVEAFQGIAEIFTSFAERLKESAGGYPEFFGQVLDLMPEDLMNVLWFAIIAGFAVAAWRKWFG